MQATPAEAFPIAYLINQYPKVSHSFIRREILELERQGFSVLRIAVRGWDGVLVDPEDIAERQRTVYLLQAGMAGLLSAALRVVFGHPWRFAGALVLALGMARRAARPWPIHLLYLAEACRMLPSLRRHGARHLHAHFGTNPAEVAMLAAKLGGLPYSFTVHGPEEFDQPERLHLARKLRHAAFVVAVSSFCRSQLYRWMAHADWHKVQIVHCALDAACQAAPEQALPTAPRLVCVGRLCVEKGQLLLLDAVHRLTSAGIALELVLAGDGELRGAIETQIAACGLQRVVRVTGWLSGAQVRAEILAARGLVLASFAEGLPVVLMEAMALRRPVLSTSIAGIPELVIPGETGYLVAAGDTDALADALLAFLACSNDELERMGRNGRRRVLERHSGVAEVAKLARHLRAAQALAAG
ncbi:MAG: glycosyltransferase [Pseudomonadota bacterium]